VENGVAERVPLHLADQRARGRAVYVQLDDGAAGRDGVEQLLQLARADGERLRRPGVPVDDGWDLPGGAQRARDSLAGPLTRRGGETSG
jgi:hypothetical protein